MTQLRDARLRRALEAAPDVDASPADATRRAIREAARQAVTPHAPPWWRRWWPAPQQRMPWNAAFATVLVGALVTLLWQGQEVPDARPEGSRVDGPIAGAPPAPAEPVAPVASAPAAIEAPAPAAAPVPRVAAPPPAPRKQAQADASPPSKQAAAREQAAEAVRERAAESAGQARDMAASKAAADAVAPAPPPPAPPPPPPAALAAPQAPAAPVARSAPRAARSELTAQFAAPALQLRVESDGRAVVTQAPRLAMLVDQLARRAASEEPLAGDVLLKVALASGVLEVTAEQVRWTAPGQSPRTGRPDAQLLQEIRDEAARVMGR